MKENAPEKLYFPIDDALETYARKDSDEEIEYTRTDAFIKKACEYLMDYEFNDSPTIADRRKRVDEFRKYMEE